MTPTAISPPSTPTSIGRATLTSSASAMTAAALGMMSAALSIASTIPAVVGSLPIPDYWDAATSKVVRRGYMMKVGHVFATWNRRFFSLDGDTIEYYKNASVCIGHVRRL